MPLFIRGITDGHQKASLIGNHSAGKNKRVLSHLSVKRAGGYPTTTKNPKPHLFKE